ISSLTPVFAKIDINECRKVWKDSAYTFRPDLLDSLRSRITLCLMCANSTIFRNCFDSGLMLRCANDEKQNRHRFPLSAVSIGDLQEPDEQPRRFQLRSCPDQTGSS